MNAMTINRNAQVVLTLLVWALRASAFLDYPEGYFPFEQSPMKSPPKVRKPPYSQSNSVCPGVLEGHHFASQSLDNLCGNLNDGVLPLNPLGQHINGESYPFNVIKNSTLQFFSKTLPILKDDKTLPKVAKYMPPKAHFAHARRIPSHHRQSTFTTTPFRNVPRRERRQLPKVVSLEDDLEDNGEDVLETPSSSALWRQARDSSLESLGTNEGTTTQILDHHHDIVEARQEGRGAKSFCQNNWGILCLIYNSLTGRNKKRGRFQRKEDSLEVDGHTDQSLRPLTPCPSAVDYVTPVFARNYQGVWRYVVQIPYEGYFTQTVEITQCLSSSCHYLSGSCLSSPRWVSLLVAEIFYPDAAFPAIRKTSSFGKPTPIFKETSTGQDEHRRVSCRSKGKTARKEDLPKHCDGVDGIGCFQVRLFYDWFLVPGSCKCWKQDFYAKFALKT